MARKRRSNLRTVYQSLDNIKKLNGQRFRVSVTIESFGGEKSEDPAYYGTILENQLGHTASHGRYYKFLEPAMRDFSTKLLNNDDINIYLDLVKMDGKRRGRKEMLEASRLYGQKAVERVQEYILVEAPQYPDRERKNPTLIESGDLFDSIKYVIRDKNGNIVSEGK